MLDARGEGTTRVCCKELVCSGEFQHPVFHGPKCRPRRCSEFLLPLEGFFQTRDVHCGTNGHGFYDVGHRTIRSTYNCCFFGLTAKLLQENCNVCCKLCVLLLTSIQFGFDSPESKSRSNPIDIFQNFLLLSFLKLQRSPTEGFLNLLTLTICAREL